MSRVVVAERLRRVEAIEKTDDGLDVTEFDDLVDGALVALGNGGLDPDELFGQGLDLRKRLLDVSSRG